MRKRKLQTKIFFGSTTEKIEEKMNKFLNDKKVCPGNYIDSKLYRLGGVYQLVFMYAELVDVNSGSHIVGQLVKTNFWGYRLRGQSIGVKYRRFPFDSEYPHQKILKGNKL